MSGDLATTGANSLLDGTALPATLYLQLHTGDPGTNGTANVSSVGSRKSFSRTSAAAGVVTNSTQIQWINITPSETITHVTVWGALTSGVCYFIDDIANVAIFTGDTVTIVIGALSITLPVWT
jgi:hypothetical protein